MLIREGSWPTQITKDAKIRKFTVGKCPLERRLRVWLNILLLEKLDMCLMSIKVWNRDRVMQESSVKDPLV